VAIDKNRPVAPDPYSYLPQVPSFQLTSTDIEDGQALPEAQTSEGGSISPHLEWLGFPENTQSFLLTCFDPDSVKEGGTFLWLVADIPVSITSVPSGNSTSMMKALASRFFRPASSIGIEDALDLPNDRGTLGYAGANPPKGDRPHRYFFAVHALDVEQLELPHGRRTAPDLAAATAVPHTIGRGVLMGIHFR
jgi:Raf kinase inhibitor-like YbhB/YbcL family protein